MSQPQKFTFDTEFDAGGGVAYQAPRPKRSFTPDEVEAIRVAARTEGERAALASIAAQQARAVAEIAAACNQAMPRLAQVAHTHRTASAALALACGRAIAHAALERFPHAPLEAAVEALAREIEAAPRLVVSTRPEVADGVQDVLSGLAAKIGFPGAVQVRADGGLAANAFTLDFGDGSAAFDPEAAAVRVTEALSAALAAEGQHADPLIPGA